jgi:hypothetical protein
MRVEWTSLDEAGEQVTNSFRMNVELVPLERFELFLIAFAGGQSSPEQLAAAGREALEGPVDFIKSVSLNWDEIVAPDKRPFNFTPEHLAIIISLPGFLTGWQLSYTRAWYGQKKDREKNSSGSPDAGRAVRDRKPLRARQSS